MHISDPSKFPTVHALRPTAFCVTGVDNVLSVDTIPAVTKAIKPPTPTLQVRLKMLSAGRAELETRGFLIRKQDQDIQLSDRSIEYTRRSSHCGGGQGGNDRSEWVLS